MCEEMKAKFPHPKLVPGSTYKPAKNMQTSLYTIDAKVYYDYLIANGFGKLLEEHGITNYEEMVGNYG